MSKQSEQKESQGYVLNAPPKNCGICSKFAMTVTHESNQYGSFTDESNLRCTVGNFAVKKTAVCLLFLSKEQTTQDQFIRADEAKALGAGNAEWLGRSGHWYLCDARWTYRQVDAHEKTIKYRAIRKEVPAEPHAIVQAMNCLLAKNEPHAELKALYAQQVKDGTTELYLWSRKDVGMTSFAPLGVPPAFFPFHEYDCTPKPTCQVRNDDTSELKTMTREAAKLLQAETKDTCDWFVPASNGGTQYMFEFTDGGIYTYRRKANLVKLDGKLMSREAAIAEWESKKDTCDVWFKQSTDEFFYVNNISWLPNNDDNAEYQLRPKAKKPVSWKDMPVGVMVVYRGQLYPMCRSPIMRYPCVITTDGHRKDFTNSDFELAPANQQPWLNWRGGDCPVSAGVIVEVTLRNTTQRSDKLSARNYNWEHNGDGWNIIEYRVIGIAEGWELK